MLQLHLQLHLLVVLGLRPVLNSIVSFLVLCIENVREQFRILIIHILLLDLSDFSSFLQPILIGFGNFIVQLALSCVLLICEGVTHQLRLHFLICLDMV